MVIASEDETLWALTELSAFVVVEQETKYFGTRHALEQRCCNPGSEIEGYSSGDIEVRAFDVEVGNPTEVSQPRNFFELTAQGWFQLDQIFLSSPELSVLKVRRKTFPSSNHVKTVFVSSRRGELCHGVWLWASSWE